MIVFVLSITGLPKKSKRIENVMEEYLKNIMAEKEEIKEQMKRREVNREKIEDAKKRE